MGIAHKKTRQLTGFAACRQYAVSGRHCPSAEGYWQLLIRIASYGKYINLFSHDNKRIGKIF